MDRRHFLKTSGFTTLAVASAGISIKPSGALGDSLKSSEPNNLTWKRYNSRNALNSLTIAASKLPDRSQLLDLAMANIPTPDRVEQIYKTIMAHTIAEENNDLDTTMATMVDQPIYEDVASGKTFVGHQDVLADYRAKYASFPMMKRHVTNVMVDKNGCFAELMWEGQQVGPVKGIKAPKNRPKIYLPVSVYYEVNEQGKIARETVYYDQYLMMLNLDLIPDIANNQLTLALLNPGLILRKD